MVSRRNSYPISKITGLKVPASTSIEVPGSPWKRDPGDRGGAEGRYMCWRGCTASQGSVRINAQLIDVGQKTTSGADSFDRVVSLENLFDIQSEIVDTVAGYLDIEVREEERLRAARRSTTDVEAYDRYMRAFAEPGSSENAIALLQEAVGRDPGFVVGHAALVDAASLSLPDNGP